MKHTLSAAIVLCTIALATPIRLWADPVTTWNRIAGDAALASCIAPADNPLHESRMYAMTHIAIHDALNAIDRRSRPYAFDDRTSPSASVDAAVAAAAHDVLVATIGEIPFPFPQACLDAGKALVETAYLAALAAIPGGPAKEAGLATGRAAATAILERRAGDGSDTPLLDFDYPQGTNPGEYRFTPGTPFVFAPGWANVTPFVLQSAAQYKPGQPPYSVTSQKYTDDYNEVKSLGGDMTTSVRTPEETEIALFWVESSPLQWNRIGRAVSTSKALSPWQSARLFALLNMALADGYIGSFYAKEYYRFWRPVTAIQEGDHDGNPDTIGDPAWLPLVQTPPITDYDSAHSVEGAAAAEVLQGFFGTDAISFSTCSLTLPPGNRCNDTTPTLRSFSSFSAAAEENGRSRILVGFHFRHAVEAGLQHGREIGKRAVNLLMKPE